MKTSETQIVNYSVAGGDTNFDSFVYTGQRDIVVQLFYTSLNQADHKLRLQKSLDGVNFLDAKDGSGTTIEITINNAISTDILEAINSFNTKFARFQFIEGTAGTGTIDKLLILME